MAQVVMKHYANKNERSNSLVCFEARFASPVRPLDKLDISLWDMGLWGPAQVSEWNQGQRREGVYDVQEIREVRFLVKVAGRIVLSHGRALLDEFQVQKASL